MDKKEPMGFRTPSAQIQKEYEELLSQIGVKKANWEKIFKNTTDAFNKSSPDLEKAFKQVMKKFTFENAMEFEHRLIALQNIRLETIVARIGMELSECNETLVSLKKELNELNKRTK